jgi:arsenite transporter
MNFGPLDGQASMSIELTTTAPTAPGISGFARYLSVWVALCIVVGVVLGHQLPGLFQTLAALEVQHINLPVAGLVWLMIVPMLLKVDFAQLAGVRGQAKGIGVTLLVNWAIKPFSMAFLGWLFVRHIFAVWLPADQLDAYMAGLILLAAAPCTAMVFVCRDCAVATRTSPLPRWHSTTPSWSRPLPR